MSVPHAHTQTHTPPQLTELSDPSPSSPSCPAGAGWVIPRLPRAVLQEPGGSGPERGRTVTCSSLVPPVPGPPVGILFPEVRTTSVRLVWQPPAAPNGIILGKAFPFPGPGCGKQEA